MNLFENLFQARHRIGFSGYLFLAVCLFSTWMLAQSCERERRRGDLAARVEFLEADVRDLEDRAPATHGFDEAIWREISKLKRGRVRIDGVDPRTRLCEMGGYEVMTTCPACSSSEHFNIHDGRFGPAADEEGEHSFVFVDCGSCGAKFRCDYTDTDTFTTTRLP